MRGLLGEGDAPVPVPEPGEAAKARKARRKRRDGAGDATAASYHNVSGCGGANVPQSRVRTTRIWRTGVEIQ